MLYIFDKCSKTRSISLVQILYHVYTCYALLMYFNKLINKYIPDATSACYYFVSVVT